MRETQAPLILLTGATGYVGGRLLKALEQAGHRVRCLARRPQFLQPKVGPTTEVVSGDVLDPESLVTALHGVHTAYYLIHSMSSRQDFEAVDRQAAEHFADAARQAGVARIVYLGGLGDSSSALSPHLRSRQEVGAILQGSGAQVLEFRSSIVIGSGSLSFELVRALTERIPVMITPRWVSVVTQPIAIEDLLAYLLATLGLPMGKARSLRSAARIKSVTVTSCANMRASAAYPVSWCPCRCLPRACRAYGWGSSPLFTPGLVVN